MEGEELNMTQTVSKFDTKISTCAKVDVHSASFARQSVRMRSNSRGAVAHTSKIGAIFPPCQDILVKKLR